MALQPADQAPEGPQRFGERAELELEAAAHHCLTAGLNPISLVTNDQYQQWLSSVQL